LLRQQHKKALQAAAARCRRLRFDLPVCLAELKRKESNACFCLLPDCICIIGKPNAALQQHTKGDGAKPLPDVCGCMQRYNSS